MVDVNKELSSELKMVWGDDDEGIFESMGEKLSELGIEVIVSDKDEEFVDLVRSEDPDIVCVDLNWSHYPFTDFKGFALAKKVRAIDSGISIVTLTARNHEAEYQERMADFGFEAIFGKLEISPTEFAEASKELAIVSRLRRDKIKKPMEISLDDYNKLSPAAKRTLSKLINMKHDAWIRKKLEDNYWIVVCNKEVVFAGESFLTPEEKKVLQAKRTLMEKRTGYPTFYFLRSPVVESLSSWRQTKGNDYYPSVPLIVRDSVAQVRLRTDFDTGSERTFISDKITSIDELNEGSPGFFKKPFFYYEKEIDIAIDGTGASGKDEDEFVPMLGCVVENWEVSGFSLGHPERKMLTGRDIMKYFPNCEFSLCWKDKTTKIKNRTKED